MRILRRRSMVDSTVDVLERLQVSLPDRVGRGRADVGWSTSGDRRRASRRVRVEGRHPRRADRRARPARVAACPRSHPSPAGRGSRGDRDLPRPGSRHRGRRPRRRHATWAQGRRRGSKPREPAADRRADRRHIAQRLPSVPRNHQSGNHRPSRTDSTLPDPWSDAPETAPAAITRRRT